MKTKDPIYRRFLKALKHEAKNNWLRQNNVLATDAKISSGSLTDILKENSKATYETRAALATACGYEYLEFLEFGKSLLENKKTALKNQETSPPVGNIIRIYNNILKKTGVDLPPEGQEELFNIIKDDLKKKSEKDTEKNIINIISLSKKRKQG